MSASAERPAVIKVGGALCGVPGALDHACAAISAAARSYRLVVVPGGGPFADAVREFERRHGLSPAAAHWMAILGMDQYAHVLADRIAGAVVVDEPGAIAGVLQAGQVPVLAPARWMRAADVLPHRWKVTSDSIAAFVAGALDARQLVLVKPVDGPVDRLVDGYFHRVLPVDLTVSVISAQRIARLDEPLTAALTS